MPRLPASIREFAKQGKVDISPWTVTETRSRIIMVAKIPDLIEANQLGDFLAAQGLLVTVSRGDKAGTTWNVLGRPDAHPAEAPVRKRRRGHHLRSRFGK